MVRGRSALQGLWSVWMTANKMVFDGEHVQEAGIVRMLVSYLRLWFVCFPPGVSTSIIFFEIKNTYIR